MSSTRRTEWHTIRGLRWDGEGGQSGVLLSVEIGVVYSDGAGRGDIQWRYSVW